MHISAADPCEKSKKNRSHYTNTSEWNVRSSNARIAAEPQSPLPGVAQPVLTTIPARKGRSSGRREGGEARFSLCGRKDEGEGNAVLQSTTDVSRHYTK